MSTALLSVTGLNKEFASRSGSVHAVKDVSFSIEAGTTFALVGESGSGKSTTGRCILRLLQPDSGTIHFDGQQIGQLSERQMRAMRKRMQIIFQDPFASLNPRMTVEHIVAEPLQVHEKLHRSHRRDRVAALLDEVGLSGEYLSRYPHEFSGGQRQRIGIARALATRPDFIVCDEPVSALDVSIQAQILNLLQDLQTQHGLTYLFIAHNLAVVEHIASTVAVMKQGEIVETAPVDQLYASPQHEYTRQLLAAVPSLPTHFSNSKDASA